MKKVVYPGSFDPITLGHLNVIERLSVMFDHVTVLVADSVRKSYLFSTEERRKLVEHEVSRFKNVTVDSHKGMTVDYAEKVGAHILVRSIRHLNDWELEVTMAHGNRKLNPKIDTMFLVTEPKLAYVNSSLVREVAINGGELSGFVTPNVRKEILKKVRAVGIYEGADKDDVKYSDDIGDDPKPSRARRATPSRPSSTRASLTAKASRKRK